MAATDGRIWVGSSRKVLGLSRRSRTANCLTGFELKADSLMVG